MLRVSKNGAAHEHTSRLSQYWHLERPGRPDHGIDEAQASGHLLYPRRQVGRAADEKVKFYDDLVDTIAKVNPEEIIITAGDLNGHVGKEVDG